MANILTSESFIDDCQLSISTISEIETAFTTFLAKTEAEFLRKVLGVKLYASFKTAWAANPTTGVWFELINGGNYNEDESYFEGLKTALIYYTYIKYQQNKDSIAVVNGNVKGNQDHATTIGITNKLVNANNRCLEICDKLPGYCDSILEFSDLNYTAPFRTTWNSWGI
jgi:hypothetical protein